MRQTDLRCFIKKDRRQELKSCSDLLWRPWPWWFSTGQWEDRWRRWPAPRSWFRCRVCTAAQSGTETLQIWWSGQTDLQETVCCSRTGYLRGRWWWGDVRGFDRHCTIYSAYRLVCCDLTVLEGKKLKDAVHNGDNDGESQQVWVGFQKGHLYKEFFIPSYM